jgi:hypothetical protein
MGFIMMLLLPSNCLAMYTAEATLTPNDHSQFHPHQRPTDEDRRTDDPLRHDVRCQRNPGQVAAAEDSHLDMPDDNRRLVAVRVPS